MDHGIIGNCQYSALISPEASIDWLCWPRFDSSPVFGSLLDPSLGKFSIEPCEQHESKQEYLRNTNILRTVFQTQSGAFEVLDFAPRFYMFNRTFAPMMLVRMVRPLRGEVSIRVRCSPTYNYGRIKPHVHWGSNHIQYEGFANRLRLTMNVPRTYLEEEKLFLLRDTKYFVLTWGEPLEAPLVETCENFFRHTKDYWQTWIKHCALPTDYQDEVIRSALTLKLHQFEDTGAIVAASTTSIPEAKGSGRTWDYRFCWLRDAYFTLSSFRFLGHFEEMEGFVNYLRNIAESSDGHFQPVYSIAGDKRIDEEVLDHLEGYRGEGPVRIGNAAYTHLQHDIYGEMILAIEPLFLDRRLAHEGGEPIELLYKLLNNIEKFLSSKDAGIWEFRTRSQVHTFSLLMHWAGCREAIKIAQTYKLKDLEQKAAKLLKKVSGLIEEECWSEKKKCYTQAMGSEHVDASLFMMVNLDYLTSEHPRAASHVQSLAKELRSKNNLIYRYVDRDDFGKPEVAFTACAFWYVEALSRLGKNRKALELFQSYLKFQSPLGLYSEDVNPETLEQWGNFPQTYSHVGLINAAFHLFGTS